ncbi:MbtH family NRPS accessory protein [Lysobacter firmicutimachus]|uniref:MbtH family NRPS accessory protein n=1 Tax=Lysobacter firmicutimachus TaxID=1792846 RepID=A0AAU8MWA1_9GAMM
MQDETNDTVAYRVVVNHEWQYSLLREGDALPSGWRDAGAAGSKRQCLALIGERWNDMRPRSVRDDAN